MFQVSSFMLYLGADHNGYELKEYLRLFFASKGIPCSDAGAKSYKKTDDYVDYAVAVGNSMHKGDLGVLICGSGHGMAIAANKLRGIRAIMPPDPRSARYGRRDDHANILVLPAWRLKNQQALKIVQAFLSQKPGAAARYLRRLKKVSVLEK